MTNILHQQKKLKYCTIFLQEIFVPKATVFFMSSELVDLRGSGSGSSNRNSIEEQHHKPTIMTSSNKNITTKSKTTTTVTTTTTLKESNNIRISNHVEAAATATAIIEEKEEEEPVVDAPKEPEVDIVVGRWGMASSENFDDFMKALGVGMMKRKMANSISPHNVISIDDSGMLVVVPVHIANKSLIFLMYILGTYTIRTESTLKTSEIKFKLGETFKESTMDGRVTDSVASREGNVITLIQTGNKGRKEKDSKLEHKLQ